MTGSLAISIYPLFMNNLFMVRDMAVIARYYTFITFASMTILSAVLLSAFDFAKADSIGFGVDLIHRDSPNSPFFNASDQTPSSLLTNALQRSVNRIKQSLLTAKTAQSLVSTGNGDYLMKLSIGTPPIEILAAVDTGSDLVWTQCKPCRNCFKQSSPLFDPKASSTYKSLPCNSKQCKSLSEAYCESRSCHYTYAFGDDSFTEGVLATDTVTLGSTSGQSFSLPHTIIGCGTYNDGNFDGTGIVGLGRGAVSLITRMDNLIDSRFSYCLVPYFSKHSSKLNFGGKSVISEPGVVSTPLVSGDTDSYYYLTLEGISVEGRRIESGKTFRSAFTEGNIIIDSGTTLTYLPEDLYNLLEFEVKEFIHLKPIDDPTQELSLCYHAKNHFIVPIIIMHFTGADLKLNSLQTFIKIAEDVICFAFASASDVAVYGNMQQMNFLIEYDLKRETLSFKEVDCTKY